MKEGNYIHKKEVDWSLLNFGLNIPVAIQVMFYENIKGYLKKGDTKKIKIIIDNEEFIASLTNINFDQSKYPNHKELLQIRYTANSPIAKKLQSVFTESYKYLHIEKEKLVNKRIPIKLPENINEFIVLYTTQFQDTFYLECVTYHENKENKKILSAVSEEEYETISNDIIKDPIARALKIWVFSKKSTSYFPLYPFIYWQSKKKHLGKFQ